jgi:threonine aldolase
MLVDLRSDTVTKPTPEMYEAMARAPLGDDVLGDDPTVKELEELSASIMGKESALFVPSGTMGNQIALRTWVKPGEAILVEQNAHIVLNESGGPGVHSQCLTWTLPSTDGVMNPQEVALRITAGSIHTPRTSLLCLENTHNRAGGTVIPMKTLGALEQVAREHGLNIHLDGARIFNAAHALKTSAQEIARHADSVMFCLSKGLSCPVGSMLTGPKDFIEEARVHRKRMGGGMRQAGILAACGIVALKTLTERLIEDHQRARRFAETLHEMPGLHVPLHTVQTNIVMVDTDLPAVSWQQRLGEQNVLCLPVSSHRLRFVFHREITDDHLNYALNVFHQLTKAMPPSTPASKP